MDFLNFSEVADEWNTTYTNSSSVIGDTEYSLLSITGLAVVVGFLILFTIVGNVLVVIAVLTSRALKPPQNLFLVSLASADILVAALVMPFSLANELMGYWFFGKVWCDIYLALDVLFCTSSIVHLCAISLDRYWSITQAIEYNQKRTPKRLKGMIVVVWLISAVISFPPLISMDRSSGGDLRPQCRLNDETWYILYSSIGSFFAPCLIMILVYIRIYQVAKTRTRTMSEKKREVEDNGTAPLDVNGLEQGGEEGGRGSLKENGGCGVVARENGHCQRQQKTPVPLGLLPNEPKSTPDPDDADDFDDSSSSDEKTPKRPPSSSSFHHHHHHHHHHHDDKKDSKPSEIRKSKGSRKSSLASSKPSEIRKSTGSRKSSLASYKPSESRKSTGSRKSRSSSRSMEMFSSRRKRRSTVNRKTITAAREKRFTFVLAVVMGVFVVCWFPFFFSYSLYGVCRAPCEIPETLFKFFFWIGYVNSSLNPVIYTIFNQDFRRAFQKILVCKSGKRSF